MHQIIFYCHHGSFKGLGNTTCVDVQIRIELVHVNFSELSI